MSQQTDRFVMNRRSFLGGSALAASALAMAGCGKKDDSAAQSVAAAGGTLTYFITNPVSIDPFNAQDVYGDMVCYNLFDALTVYDFDAQELKGLAAESWEVNDTADEFIFKIKKGNKFHNGEDVDAKAFKRSWERTCNPNTTSSPSVVSYNIKLVEGYSAVLDGSSTDLSGVTCPDDYTLKVKLSTPFADFPYVCSMAMMGPVPKAALDDFDTYFSAPIGNGPFQMDGKWEDGQYINLKRYDDYANGNKPKLEGFHFNIQKDVETAYKEFQAGTIDIAEVPTAQIKDAISQYGQSDDGYTITPGKQCLMGDEPSTYFLTCNVTDPVMADVHLRHAISLAINRQAFCDALFEGTRSPADGIVAPSCKGYEAGAWPDARYDKDAAVQILDQYYPADSSGSRGLDLKLSYNLDGSHKQIMESVISDLNAVGINVESETKEFAAILQDYDDGTFQFGRLGWMASYPMPDAMTFPLFYTGNGDNTSHYSNAEVDAALLAARATTEESARLDKYKEVDALLAADMPVIPLMFYKHNKVGSKRIKKAYISPMEMTQANDWEVSD